jgi:CheY-like chemotaxis protein
MSEPVALVFYDEFLTGSQLVNRLRDLGYTVQLVSELGGLVEQAIRARPLVLVTQMRAPDSPVGHAIRALRSNPATGHIPVLLFAKADDKKLAQAASLAGATLVASDAGIQTQLRELLDQALQVE